MLNEIREVLEGLNIGPVQYGRVTDNPELWNYVVFGRDRMSRSGTSKVDYNRYYTVVIVHEDYIPEGMEVEVMKALNDIKGLKVATEDIQYDYMIKNKSGIVVEAAVITLTEPLKGYML